MSHVGWGMNPGARYEALTMYDKNDTNGTELRAVSGNFLFSTGANEFAGRYTSGHFDLPMMGTTIELDGVAVVQRRRAAGRVRVGLCDAAGSIRSTRPVLTVRCGSFSIFCATPCTLDLRSQWRSSNYSRSSTGGRASPKCLSNSTISARRFSR